MAVLKHLDDDKKRQFIVEILSTEGVKSAEIEGKILERESVQSSIQRHFGLTNDASRFLKREQGMGDLMWDMCDGAVASWKIIAFLFPFPISHICISSLL